VALGVVLLLVTSVLGLTIPYLLGRTVDALQGPDPAHAVPPLALIMVGFAVVKAIVRIGSRVSIFNAARMAEHDLRSELFGHLLALEPAYFRDHPTGDVMSRLTNDVQTVRALWGPGLLNVVNTTFVFGTALILMLLIDPMLTLWAMLPYPAIIGIGQLFGRRIYRASRDVQAQLGSLSTSVQEDLTGIGVIKSYTLEEDRRENFRRQSEALLACNMSLTKIRGCLMPILGGLASLGTVAVIFVGGKAVVDGRIDLGQMVQFNAYLAMLLWPTLALGWMISLFQRGLASWTRIRELLASRPKITSPERARPAAAATPAVEANGEGRRRHAAAIEVRELTVEIDGRKLLDRVSLDIPAGSVTAIVGRTGSGKSTLVEALPRLIDIPRGSVFLDGVDICDVPLDELRSVIGYAPQEAFLFSTTIADNIQYALAEEERPDRPGALLTKSATAAGLEHDLTALPDGFDTVVGERGITLSGGQRQRVALARALAADPPVLILDDSLSSVDAETERRILGQLTDVIRGRTAILISHRVAAVMRADQIAVIDAGTIVESGTHAELLEARGLYAELYESQLADHTLGLSTAREEDAALEGSP